MRLQRLNMDNSWHLALGGLRLLIDPWLEGVEFDYFKWFNTQWHRTAPLPYPSVPTADAVLITQKYQDHCHPPTLQRLQPKHILAPSSLQRHLTRIVPAAKVYSMDAHNPVVRFRGVSVHHLPTRRRVDPIYDAFALDDGTISVVLAPHGFALDDGHRTSIEGMSPCGLLIAPFDHYRLPTLLGGVVSPGLPSLQRLCDVLDPTYIARAHDEDKHARGLVRHLARIRRFDKRSLKDYPWLATRWLQIRDYTPVDL